MAVQFWEAISNSSSQQIFFKYISTIALLFRYRFIEVLGGGNCLSTVARQVERKVSYEDCESREKLLVLVWLDVVGVCMVSGV
jgi:hypothetical protein